MDEMSSKVLIKDLNRLPDSLEIISYSIFPVGISGMETCIATFILPGFWSVCPVQKIRPLCSNNILFAQ